MENYKERIKKLVNSTVEGKIKWKVAGDEIIRKDFQWIKLTAEHENQNMRLEAFFDISPKENPSNPSDVAKGTDVILTFQTGETFHLSFVEKPNPSTQKMEVESFDGAPDILRLFIYAYVFSLSSD